MVEAFTSNSGEPCATDFAHARILTRLDLGEGPLELFVPNANIRIQESRAEAYVANSWTVRQGCLLETRLAQESSRLDFSGDTISSVSLTYDAPGNIGEARVNGAQIIASLSIGRFIPGGTVDVDATWRDSSVRDPSTGETRPLSLLAHNSLKAGFRQDVPGGRFAWGFTYNEESPVHRYYFGEVDIRQASSSLDIFAERQIGPSMKLQLTARSVLNDPETRTRTFYTSPRPAAVDRIERRSAKPGHWLYLTLSGWF